MRFEFSAGGIVYKNQKGAILILAAQHSQHHGWVFPKGLINERSTLRQSSGQEIKNQRSKIIGETKEQAALREVKEETGVYAKIVKPLTPVTYWYNLKDEKIKKTVYYFLMKYVSGNIKDHDFEMENVEWLPMDEVEKRLTYLSDKKVWMETKKLIF